MSDLKNDCVNVVIPARSSLALSSIRTYLCYKFKTTIMKKLIALFLLLSFGGYISAQTIVDPNARPTISKEEIQIMGQNYSNRVIVLTFEGLGDQDPINNFYDGGLSGQGFTGPDYNIQFSSNALSIIDGDAGGSGNFANEPSPSTILFFLSGQPFMNVPAGFSTGFSCYYTSTQFAGSLTVYDGLNGTGNVLAVSNFPATGTNPTGGDPNGSFNIWQIISVPFSGVAKSVVFGGVQNQIGFDDITFGSTTPGVQTPVTNWALFIGIGLILVFAIVRFRRIV